MRRLRQVGLALLAFGAVATATATAGAASSDALASEVDALVTAGFEHPDRALPALRSLQRTLAAASPRDERLVLAAIGLVEARAGQAVEAAVTAERLLASSGDDAAFAAANLVRAESASTAGQADVAAALAQPALAAFVATCPPDTGSAAFSPTGPVPADCDWRSVFDALRILSRRSETLGLNAAATSHAEAALRLAEWAGDARRQSLELTKLARLALGRGDRAAAEHQLERARRVASQPPDLAEQALIASTQATLLVAAGDLGAGLRARERARALAAQADAPRLEAQVLAALSDTFARAHRPAEALEAAERALATVRRFRDLRAERVLINNAGIAKIGLGRIAEGKMDLARLLELWEGSGEAGREAQTLTEFGEALGAAGEFRDALELYHRERKITEERMRTNRKVALRELQARNDALVRQRDIELLARENALQTAALANRDLLGLIWSLVTAVLILGCGLVALLYRRVRRTHRRLASLHAELSLQSERDPLTQLANRRHFQTVIAGLAGADTDFTGALLLVDIDHFKKINDSHGHAAGDQALVAVSRRLESVVRAGDLVVRWGGEEFLILAPGAGKAQAEQMAARVLAVVGDTPVEADGRTLRVTVSVGHAAFPLPAGDHRCGWHPAVELADQALLHAKAQGRNRAVGIVSLREGADALQAVQAGFAAAARSGWVTLRQTPGPAVLAALQAG